MNGNYLIPANSKKSMLILGFFTPIDLIIFGVGATFTLIMLMVLQTNSLWVMILIITPALISAFLVMPIPNYHNMLQLLTNIFSYYINRRKYYWRGWAVNSMFGKQIMQTDLPNLKENDIMVKVNKKGKWKDSVI